MTDAWEVKQGDTRVFENILRNDDGSRVDLTGCAVRLIVRDPNTFTPTFTAAATINGDPTNGDVSYLFTTTNTAEPGSYLAEWSVTFPDNEVISIPSGSYIPILITPDLDAASFPNPAGTSVTDLLEDMRGHLEGSQRTIQNQLTADLDKTQTVINLAVNITPVVAGDRISAGIETMYVVSYDQTLRAATVIRGSNNSPVTLHSRGELIYINPRFTGYRMFRALNSALGRMSSEGLWQAKTLLRTVNVQTRTYDLADDMQSKRILEVTWERPGMLDRWAEVRDYDVLRVSPTEYPSGRALMTEESLSQGQNLRIVYAAKIGFLQSIQDDVASATGLEPSAFDLPPLGAAILLLAGGPVQRADTRAQGGTRRAEEVSTTDVLQAPSALRQLYAQRLAQEIQQLNSEWEIKTRLRAY